MARGPDSGAIAVALRGGDLFAVARGRSGAGAVASAVTEFRTAQRNPTKAQLPDLIDCEISFGTVTSTGWMVTASTWPFLEGRECRWRVSSTRMEVSTATSPDATLSWPMDFTAGDFDLFTNLPSPREPQ